MLVYRGMDLGTAKPTPLQRQKIRHHLIDLVSSRSSFSVYRHRKRALIAIEKILKRGRIPLVVGGSGLYLDLLWKGVSEIPRPSPKISAPRSGNLYERLRQIDPERARAIHPHDRRRIVRALEIADSSGKIPSEWFQSRSSSLADLGYSVKIFGIARGREGLYRRINRRVEAMFRKGLVGEVKRLKRIGFSKTARQALGYREVLASLRGGVADKAISGSRLLRPALSGGSRNDGLRELIQLIQKHTRRFAKRQLTWFRKEKKIRWISWEKGEPASAVCDKIMKELGDSIHG